MNGEKFNIYVVNWREIVGKLLPDMAKISATSSGTCQHRLDSGISQKPYFKYIGKFNLKNKGQRSKKQWLPKG